MSSPLEQINLDAPDVLTDWFERFDLYRNTNEKITNNNATAFLLTMAGGSDI